MTHQNTLPPFQIVILSDNYFLWLGLTTLIPTMITPRPDIFWINEVTPKNILRMREQVMNTAGDSGWLLFTDEHRVNAINVYLPNARVKVLSGKLSLKELSQQLNNADFTAESEPEPTLTRQELQVCSLISKGISLVRIAQMLHKSPKTIYTHKRNAMTKFRCQNLAEFHQKISLLNRPSQ